MDSYCSFIVSSRSKAEEGAGKGWRDKVELRPKFTFPIPSRAPLGKAVKLSFYNIYLGAEEGKVP
jgi:hypothetical protein